VRKYLNDLSLVLDKENDVQLVASIFSNRAGESAMPSCFFNWLHLSQIFWRRKIFKLMIFLTSEIPEDSFLNAPHKSKSKDFPGEQSTE